VGEPVNRTAVREAIGKNLRRYHKITYEGANPFDYVKMYRAAGASGGGGVTGVNLARYHKAAADASREQGDFKAANAFDGDPNTRWSSFLEGGTQNENDAQWILVELDNVYKINRVVLNWEGAYGKDYRIDVSTDSTNWTEAVAVANNTSAGIKTHTFPVAAEAKYVRMFGISRGSDYGFSLIEFEVYGEEAVTAQPSEGQAKFFIPKANETGYWWQGENARLASMASAFIIGAQYANPGPNGELWSDTLYAMAAAQLDWILGRNPFNVCMMFGYGENNYPNYPAARPLPNIRGGICNGITSDKATENGVQWLRDPGDEAWQDWRWIEQWLPHNAWYTVAISSLSHRIEHGMPPEIASVRHSAAAPKSRFKVSMGKGRVVRVDLPFSADSRTDAAIYSMRGKKLYSYSIKEGSRAASIKIPANIAHGAYVLSVRDGTGKNKVTGRIYLK
jgi:hypothetical protein